MSISALVLTKNEQEMIGDALSQLGFADEIIILDQESQDKTLEIAKKYTKNIHTTAIEDYSTRRNILKQSASGDWLLYIDPDERLSKEGIVEIKEAVEKGDHSAYYLPRKNYVLGKVQTHGGWWPDYVPKLFKAADLEKWEGKVHESPKINGTYGYLKTPLVHKTARSMKAMLGKSTKWAKVEANLYYEAKSPKVTIPKVLKFSLFEFIKRYFIKLGILDGRVGLISSLYQAIHNVMILTYLWEMQNNTQEAFKRINNEHK
ncbi:MAG TPA: glycosyltransferase family 2 protein [Candidatus Saccharimonadales bacterium]|nr:glycosyltransferase family 2 protein [Candidatus Saccharimonadales bacterium]